MTHGKKRREEFDAFANDVWSFGVILMSCFSEGLLWERPDIHDKIFSDRIKNIPEELHNIFEIDENQPRQHHHIVKAQLKLLTDILVKIFSNNENERPTIRQVISSPFFDDARKSFSDTKSRNSQKNINRKHDNKTNKNNKNNDDNNNNNHHFKQLSISQSVSNSNSKSSLSNVSLN